MRLSVDAGKLGETKCPINSLPVPQGECADAAKEVRPSPRSRPCPFACTAAIRLFPARETQWSLCDFATQKHCQGSDTSAELVGASFEGQDPHESSGIVLVGQCGVTFEQILGY